MIRVIMLLLNLFNSSKLQPAHFCVINSVGQIVKLGNSDFVDFREFQSGIYIIRLEGYTSYKIYWNEEKW